MMSVELQQAIDALQIEDVYLRESSAKCDDDFDPKHSTCIEKLSAELMYLVRQSAVVELPDEVQLLRVFVDVGSRWVDPESSEDEPKVLAIIQAEYIAEYRMNFPLEQSCIDEFALKNVSYHVWPYWREFLSSQCERMRLPRVTLPTRQLAHNRHLQASESDA